MYWSKKMCLINEFSKVNSSLQTASTFYIYNKFYLSTYRVIRHKPNSEYGYKFITQEQIILKLAVELKTLILPQVSVLFP